MYSKHKEEKFVATEMLFRLLSTKFQKTQYKKVQNFKKRSIREMCLLIK